eukprot:CAMPEP_0195034958 /NCGR_PEP_ID=MMETSP0326_2-20130528/68989_1 /TAXON_ID=2866 ORGANISM="Crypthecodinium cohnii, Strain Seligo" /NCGR_SAMPLE_ID=MMETSP0326_2 /ASSEMBLY_ACC=CAM_ASM_000348 /LENGTH=87 /DNA_ID=CAMNT_0040059947 /DNA_START=165 /DNA_END=425 /DNA_ORIENTATION=-
MATEVVAAAATTAATATASATTAAAAATEVIATAAASATSSAAAASELSVAFPPPWLGALAGHMARASTIVATDVAVVLALASLASL